MTETILGSSLKEEFELIHFDNSLNERLSGIGRMGLGKGIRLWKQYRRMGRILREQQPELTLVPLSQTPAGFIKDARFVHLAKKAGSKVIGHLHGGELDRSIARSSPSVRPYMERTLRSLDAGIVLGEGLRRIFRPYLPEDRIFTVPNGIRVPEERKMQADDPTFRVLFLSNPMKRKGIEELVGAVRSLKESGKELQLDVLGEWYEKDLERTLKRKVEEEELPVRFHEASDGDLKRSLLQGASLFVLPSREPEGLPVSLLEAMGHGLPIIATGQGAIPDAVVDGENGSLVLPQDPEGLAEKIQELMEDPEKLRLFGERSRERYETRFTEECLSQNLYHCLDSVLKHPA